jgi:hypothetical protein
MRIEGGGKLKAAPEYHLYARKFQNFKRDEHTGLDAAEIAYSRLNKNEHKLA